MMDVVKASNNPSSLMNQMMMNNPNMKQVMDIINQYGGDPEKAFRTVAEKNGYNPQDILDLFK